MANTTFHPFLAVHRLGPPDSRYFGQLPHGFGHILLRFVALHQSIRSDQPGVKEYSTGPISPRQSIALLAILTIPNEAIDREPPLRVAPGATAAPTDTDHSTAYPGGGSSRKIMAVARTIFPPARSAKRYTRTMRSTQSTEDNFKTSIAASPSLTRARRLRASSAHSREAESDRFLACAAEKNRCCRRRARDDARRRSHLLPSVLTGCSVNCCFFPVS